MVSAAPSLVGEERFVLYDVSWELYEHLLEELSETSGTRLTYDRGVLEFMTPLMPHERNNRLIEKLIDILAEEMELNLLSVGSMTCKRKDLERGAEPDSSYYIQNELRMRSKERVDLTQDPPPDLVLEIEYSRPQIDKLALYAAMGVPEFWRFNGSDLRFYRLEAGQYLQCEQSTTFAPIRTSEIPRFLRQSLEIGEMAVKREFRAWVREQISR